LHGLQSWVALPAAHEEATPVFHHHPAATLPALEQAGARLRVIAGSAYGFTSPVATLSDLFYVDAALEAGARLTLPEGYSERALYVALGDIEIGGESFVEGMLPIFEPRARVELQARTRSRVMLLGGTPLEGERHIWWNFVSSSAQRIERAKADWREQRFARVPGESEFTPLPPG
jgi:redox-sensitive bicupin YhaK (pirin superfamily)